jgi:NAD(P)-dependent dehydrogenase (short-subunit alcohol dehydrogenase family)
MSNPVVLITGALTGIGRAAAIAFAKKGAKVVVAGRRDEAGKALVKELRSFGSEAEFINADVRKEDEVRALVDKTVARFGRLDVRHECSRRDPEHEARSARHARSGQR